MEHLGDLSKINGAKIAPVDIIAFGSPCQDLSVAGKRAGLGGDRSGLFAQAVRIIKEMRCATDGKQPKFAVWENVPGAFNSNRGGDFKTVIQEVCKITEPKAPAVAIPKYGWPYAGSFTNVGGGSVAYRTIDAKLHGVPQRRRRIFLVCDFTAQCAGDILFNPQGLPGYSAADVPAREGDSRTTTVGADRPICRAVSGTRLNGDGSVMAVQGSMIGRADKNGPRGSGISIDTCFTLTARDGHAVVDYVCGFDPNFQVSFGETTSALTASSNKDPFAAVFVHPRGHYVRRFTPTEYARLQGFPDWWANIPTIVDMSEADFGFWQGLRQTFAEINGKIYKPCTKMQMIKWYNKLHTDGAEYKMWGNGVALPVVRIPLHGMAQRGAKTMGSLFDGSGGFPLAGLLEGIKTLWAAEVAPYPVAVTKWNFEGRAQLLMGDGINAK